jgi:hypothetical protein
VKAFEVLKEDACEAYFPIITYLESYYIGELLSGSGSHRKVPMFPIQTWNVHERTMENRSRTQNNQEAWHGVFASNVKRCPDAPSLVRYTQTEQKSTEVAMSQLYAGQCWPRRKKQVTRDEAILSHLKDFDPSKLALFIDIVSVVISQDKDAITSDEIESINAVISNVIEN